MWAFTLFCVNSAGRSDLFPCSTLHSLDSQALGRTRTTTSKSVARLKSDVYFSDFSRRRRLTTGLQIIHQPLLYQHRRPTHISPQGCNAATRLGGRRLEPTFETNERRHHRWCCALSHHRDDQRRGTVFAEFAYPARFQQPVCDP